MRLLLLTTPELHGPDVAHVQDELKRHGVDPGPIDGIYGAATAKAVRRFQRHAELRVDGVVGPATAKMLAEHEVKRRPQLPGREPPGSMALSWMADRLGEKEHPPGSNHTPITVEFGIGNVPWCMETVSLAFKHGAGFILGDQVPHPWGFWPERGFAYVPAFEAWAKSRGFWMGRAAPLHGDVACYAFGHAEPVHVGIVERYVGGGEFDALEGNTAIGNDSNGGELMRRRRYVSQVTGFARVTHRQP